EPVGTERSELVLRRYEHDGSREPRAEFRIPPVVGTESECHARRTRYGILEVTQDGRHLRSDRGLRLPAWLAPDRRAFIACQELKARRLLVRVDETEKRGRGRDGNHAGRDGLPAQDSPPRRRAESNREDEEATPPRVIGDREGEQEQPDRRGGDGERLG